MGQYYKVRKKRKKEEEEKKKKTRGLINPHKLYFDDNYFESNFLGNNMLLSCLHVEVERKKSYFKYISRNKDHIRGHSVSVRWSVNLIYGHQIVRGIV